MHRLVFFKHIASMNWQKLFEMKASYMLEFLTIVDCVSMASVCQNFANVIRRIHSETKEITVKIIFCKAGCGVACMNNLIKHVPTAMAIVNLCKIIELQYINSKQITQWGAIINEQLMLQLIKDKSPHINKIISFDLSNVGWRRISYWFRLYNISFACVQTIALRICKLFSVFFF